MFHPICFLNDRWFGWLSCPFSLTVTYRSPPTSSRDVTAPLQFYPLAPLALYPSKLSAVLPTESSLFRSYGRFPLQNFYVTPTDQEFPPRPASIPPKTASRFACDGLEFPTFASPPPPPRQFGVIYFLLFFLMQGRSCLHFPFLLLYFPRG